MLERTTARVKRRGEELETLEKEREAASQKKSDEGHLLEHTAEEVRKRREEPQPPLVASGW